MINFSFIVLFHNNNATDCVINSILDQFLSGDEIIIVNDHSTDESLQILTPFKDSVKIVNTDRQGNRGYNRNFGADYAQNDYLMFVDGDIVFLPNAITAMRVSMEKGNIGAVGNVICSSNTSAQMNIVTGIDYLNLIRTDLNIENIIKLNMLSDRRQRYIYDKIALNSVWEYFYTAYVAVNKKIFCEIGGFETCFVGWGAEDDEFGYRLHLKGKLDYNLSAYAVHVPHMRDLYKCLMTNRVNLYRFLAKFPSNTIEIHMTFGNCIKTQLALNYIKKELINSQTYIYPFPNTANIICVNELTEDYPSGYVRFMDKNSTPHVLELFGLALPFRNNNFDVAYCTENLFVYPEPLAAGILTELLRVAKEVRIIKTENPLRMRWDFSQISGLTHISTSGRIVYSSTQISDFDIIEEIDHYKISDGITAKLNEHFIVEENFYHPELFEIPKEHYVILNLTGRKLTAEEKASLMHQYEIIIDSCYDIDVELSDTDIRLTQVLYGDLYRLHTRMLYLIPQGYRILKDDKWWYSSFREHDIIRQNP